MERNNMDLALFNILGVTPLIDNIEDHVDGLLNQTLVRLYERNLDALSGSNMDLALYNILDITPWIDNIGDDNGTLNQTLLLLYERNVAALIGHVQEP